MFNYEEKSQEELRPKELFELDKDAFLKLFQEQITLRKNGLSSISGKFPMESFLTVFTERFVVIRPDYQELIAQVENGSITSSKELAEKHTPIFNDEILRCGILL
ncbi:hypothetical protein SDC9_33236 [bioreactor metagenome]|uniref:Uncharacterized protein n=1 Tax=bioreactor metagenome TaxID=1076179 RepID=A0A644V7Q5_9ZZZZ|nr:hypothetical protein [Candidatus Elulimicrobiales bacterium]